MTTSAQNTVSLSTDLNVAPYYDDFDETKNFHRILFRPGLAVQARELTQMQSMLQNQIDRFAEHIFKEGSVVSGIALNYDPHAIYLRIQDADKDGNTVNVNNFIDSTITGSANGVQAVVIDVEDGSEAALPDTKTLFIKYTRAGTDANVITFSSGEVIKANTGPCANVIVGDGDTVSNNGIRVTLGDGIIFAKDHFVRVDEQSIVVSKYNVNTDIKVGYLINENIVRSANDETLLDPAQGAYNYAAPGADRLQLTATITTQSVSANSTNNFVEILRLKNGQPEFKADKPQYSIINDYIARRTFDESGNYIVEGLAVRLREHLNDGTNMGVYTTTEGGDSDALSVDIAPGKAYVRGYELDNLLTVHVPIDKGIDSESTESLTVPANYGNYMHVQEVVGVWDINGHDVVSLRDAPQGAISNGTFSTTGVLGSEIGIARVRALELEDGEPGQANSVYRMYLYDIQMNSSIPFANTRCVFMNNATLADGYADVTLGAANSATLLETSFNRAVFPIPSENLKTLQDDDGNYDITFKFMKQFETSFATDGTLTLLTGAADENYQGSGALNNTQKSENFHVVSDGTAESTTDISGGTLTITSGQLTGGTAFDTELLPGDLIDVGGSVYTVNSVTSSTTATVVGTPSGSGTGKRTFLPGQVLNFNGAGRSITVNSPTSVTLDMNLPGVLDVILNTRLNTNLTKVDGPEASKVFKSNRYVKIDIATNSAGTSGPWDLGFSDVFAINSVRYDTSAFTSANQGSDVTSSFTLDTGQKDNYYAHGKLKLKSGASYVPGGSDFLRVNLDFFTHVTTSGIGYFSVDSYPVDDVDTSNTNAITTAEIPIFISPVSGNEYNLRNSIDIRPRITDTANTEATAVAGATTNPAASNNMVEPATSIHFATPNENFQFDLQFYLPRRDRIVMTPEGSFRVIRGVPSNNPQTPPSPSDGMTIALVDVAAYPSLPYENARRLGKYDNVSTIKPVRHVRFTMKDIGVLKDRINNLEYYTSLSLLENDTRNMTVFDVNGLERFKNGILVDPFSGHNIGNPKDADYKISIDPEKQELRPMFTINDVSLAFESDDSVSVEQNGKYITLPIVSHDVIIDQPQASNVRNATGLFYSFRGELTLSPDTDYWTDTTTQPDVQVNFDFNTEAWQTLANAFGTEWGSWRNVFRDVDRRREVNTNRRGTTRTNIETTTVGQERTGTRINVIPETLQQSLGESVRNVNIIPFIRSKIINFFACGLKPRARVYAFFDGEDVNAFCRPTDSVFGSPGSLGDPLIVDDNGEIYGQFRIPNNETIRFRIGTLTFLLTDNLFGRTGQGESTTHASDQYSAQGLSQSVQNTIVSTRVPKVSLDTVTETRTTSRTTRSSRFTPTPEPVRSARPRRPRISQTAPERPQRRFSQAGFSPAATERGGGGGGDGGDPIAQTFTVDFTTESTLGNRLSPGGFLTKIDLYFQSKDSTQPVKIEIRECDPSTGYVTDKVLPFSTVIIPAANVNVSDNASAATTVNFDTPIYVLANTPYAVIIKPVADNPNYTVWTARLGDTDVITGNRITTQPATGIFFASSNDRVWTPIQEEDLKYTLYIANFGTDQSGIAAFRNEAKEFLSLNAATGNLGSIGASLVGETTLNLSSVLGTIDVNDEMVGQTSAANGTVTSVETVGSTQVVRLKLVNGTFQTGEQAELYESGVATGFSRQISSQSTPTGIIDHYDPNTQDTIKMHLTSPSGEFLANTTVVDTESGASANVFSVDRLSLDTMHTSVSKLDLQDTEVVLGGRFATSNTSMDSDFFNIEDDEDTTFITQKFILGNTLEEALGSKTGNINVGMSNGLNARHSPVIDSERTSLFAINNLINNDATGEANTSGGNALARYITRTVTLADGQDAEDLKVYITAYKPSTADIKVYYKILHAEDGDELSDRTWVEMNQVTKTSVKSDEANIDDFKEYEYTIPPEQLTAAAQEANTVVQYTNSTGTVYTGYKYYSIKIVLLSSTPTNVPRVRDLRAIALQA